MTNTKQHSPARRVARSARVTAVVDTPPGVIWRVIADVTRTGEWSHECHAAAWLGGATAAAPGVRFRGANRSGRLRWSRTCEIITAEEPRELAWRTLPPLASSPAPRPALARLWASKFKPLLDLDSTEWRVTLEPAGAGTRITQAYQVLRMPAWLDRILAAVTPSHVDRTAALEADLRRLGAVAAAAAGKPDLYR